MRLAARARYMNVFLYQFPSSTTLVLLERLVALYTMRFFKRPLGRLLLQSSIQQLLMLLTLLQGRKLGPAGDDDHRVSQGGLPPRQETFKTEQEGVKPIEVSQRIARVGLLARRIFARKLVTHGQTILSRGCRCRLHARYHPFRDERNWRAFHVPIA